MFVVTNEINKKYDTSFSESDMTDLSEFWKDIVPQEMVHWGWGPECFNNEEFLQTIPPNHLAVDAIQLLLAADCPVVISTDRPVEQLPWIARYLARHEIVLPVVTSQALDGTKELLIDEYSITCAIDDSPSACQKFADRRSTSVVFLWDAPWNKAMYLPLDTKIKRMFGWSDLIDRIVEEEPEHELSASN